MGEEDVLERKKVVEGEYVPLGSRLWLGGADCMIATLCNIMTGGGLTFFFVNYYGMDAKWSATCWLLFGIWNAVNDPLFGYISDRTKSKLGRRIPYIRSHIDCRSIYFILGAVVFYRFQCADVCPDVDISVFL